MVLWGNGSFTGVSGKSYGGNIYTSRGLNITTLGGRISLAKLERGHILINNIQRDGQIYRVTVKGVSPVVLKRQQEGSAPIDADVADALGISGKNPTPVPTYAFYMDCYTDGECNTGLNCCKTPDLSHKECVKRSWAYLTWTPAKLAQAYPTLDKIQEQIVAWQKMKDTATNNVDGCGITEATLMLRNLEDAKPLLPAVPPQEVVTPPTEETTTPKVVEPEQPREVYQTGQEQMDTSSLQTVVVVAMAAIIGGIALYIIVRRK